MTSRSDAVDIEVFETDLLYHEAADLFADAANQAVSDRSVFTVALAGGKTPEPLYSLLACKYRESVPWAKSHIFFSDERCVPPDHRDSNFGMANRVLLYKVPVPSSSIHRMKGEIDSVQAAAEYERCICQVCKVVEQRVPVFDLMILGMGGDGHTASIFPCTDTINETEHLVAAVHDPEHRHNRITFTPPVILAARRIMVLVTGEEKAETLARVLNGPYEPHELPIQILRNAQGQVTWFVDPDAAEDLEPASRIA